eukprot:TRINITY_DN1287_c0_g3_i2.p1 TRINITY_DN1287_c0_g3~~TRINITY_DN1287_c0_g3_i2.p1  ORF type:complete len:431 (+),score=254.34 TRINITY_DN1287_c0_g3_i2:61-1353(+)
MSAKEEDKTVVASSDKPKKEKKKSSSSSKDKEKKKKTEVVEGGDAAAPAEEKKKKKSSSSSSSSSSKEKKKKSSSSHSSSKEGSSSTDPEKKKKKKSSSSSSSEKKKKSSKDAPAAPEAARSGVATADDMSDGEEDGSTFAQKYEKGPELGRGAFSVVYEATSRRSNRKYAVKIIEKKNVGQDMVRLRTEIEILKRVQHPNIIRLKEIIEDSDTLYIITEMVTGGELFDKIVDLGAYTEAEAATLVRKMVSAIDYLHAMDIVHRDLKPENLLLKDSNDISNIKLADFGLSKIVSSQVAMQTACGTPGYVAPEVLNATGYGPEVDLWSIGVITYILLCGFPPFYNESLPMLFEQIMKAEFDYPPDYWDEISDSAKNFINRLLVVDPAKRMSTKQALEHPWLAGAAPEKTLSKVNQKMGESITKHRDSKARS